MRFLLSFILIALCAPASAHIGHLGDVAGHGHWIALGGIAIAAGIAILGARKKPRNEDQDSVEDDIEDLGETEDGEPA